MVENENAFKNFINAGVVKELGEAFAKAHPKFDTKAFNKLSDILAPLELKARVLLLTAEMGRQLPEDFKIAAPIVKKVLNSNSLNGFQLWPVSEYISQFGVDDLDVSMDLMYIMTQSFTSEFAIRPFLLKHPEKTLKILESWINDENVHIRRWVSEGTRPNLPWGGKIPSFIKKPATLHLLESLKYDEELYVRKSVSNHLNDISKDHPELLVKILKNWNKDAPAEHKAKIKWITKQALRTMIKKGHPGALGLMDVKHGAEVEVSKIKLNQKEYKLGDVLSFEFSVVSKSINSQDLIVDYLIGFIKSNGSLSHKVFKLKHVTLKAGEKLVIKKNHSLKKITTMTFFPGEHEVQIQVNGKIMKKASWNFRP